MSLPILHGVVASPFVRKVRVALAEKAVDYTIESVMPMGVSDAFRKISPLGKIPVWQDGDFILPDSSVICAYLERTHPEPRLYPEDPRAFGRALWFEEYADTRLSETVAPVFFQRFVRVRVFKQVADEAIVARQVDELLPAVFDYLESEVPDEGWLCGGAFGIAEIALGSFFANLRHAGEDVEASRWPRLRGYVDRALAWPTFARVLDEEKAAIAAL